MGIHKIPPHTAPLDVRVVPEKVWFSLWFVPQFPLALLNGKLDKDVTERPWIMGLLADIRQAGVFRNPVVVWNHHPNRLTGKQPAFLLRAGSNRVWCAEQLGWTSVPAVLTLAVETEMLPGVKAYRITPDELQGMFPDGGKVWANEHGIGLQLAPKPEVTYSQYIPTSTEISDLRPTDHGRDKLINPLES